MTGPELRLRAVSAWYGDERVLADIDARFPAGAITAVLGSAGAGKSTLGRLFNRLAELEPGFRHTGDVEVGGVSVRDVEPATLRRDVGMVFERPAAFPGSIRENVSFGLAFARLDPAGRDARVEAALRRADLWAEVRDRLSSPASALGPGQRQRLCIARALALEPRVLVLDEPTARLHPAEGARVEAVLEALVPAVTVLLITPEVAQAGRVASHVALLDGGRLIEEGAAEAIFTNPRQPGTQAYLSRRYR